MRRSLTTLAIVLLFALPVSTHAADRNGGPNWGTVVGAGILGGIIGGATAPAPQPQIIVVVPPAPAAPPPQPPPPAPTPVIVSASCGGEWYPTVKICSAPWLLTPGGPHPVEFLGWCAHYQQWYPAVQTCPGGFYVVMARELQPARKPNRR
jgi:hypothetical protein